ncbi:hypothetical protein ACRAWG_25585 [Methylobacterium sp. P31]
MTKSDQQDHSGSDRPDAEPAIELKPTPLGALWALRTGFGRGASETEGPIHKNALAERSLNAEMEHHLVGAEAGSRRNDNGRKTATTKPGRIEFTIASDRRATSDN